MVAVAFSSNSVCPRFREILLNTIISSNTSEFVPILQYFSFSRNSLFQFYRYFCLKNMYNDTQQINHEEIK